MTDEEIIAAYDRGDKIKDIAREGRVPLGEVFAALDRRAEPSSRRKAVADLLEVVEQLAAENAELRRQIGGGGE